jgi:hypothetical protein
MPVGIHNPIYSLKPRLGRSWKRARRIEIVALLESKFISDAEIANHLGLTIPAITAIKSTPEFLAKRVELATGIMSQYTAAFELSDQDVKDDLRALVPIAIMATKRAALDPTSPHHFKAVDTILDRNLVTAKTTKTEHSVKDTKDLSEENRRSLELLNMLGEEDSPKSPVLPNLEGDYKPPVGLLEETRIANSETEGTVAKAIKEEIAEQERNEVNLEDVEISGPVN